MSVTEFLKEYPSKSDGLIFWVVGQVQNYLAETHSSKWMKHLKTPKFLHGIYEELLNKTADAGSEMHELIENYLDACKEFNCAAGHPEVDKLYELMPDNVKRFFDKIGSFKVLEVENRVFDDKLMVAGTGDAKLLVGDDVVKFDWKSSKAVHVKHKVQVGFYAKNDDCDYGCVVCFGAKNKQGFSVSKVDKDSAYDILLLMKQIKDKEKLLTYKKK